MKIYTIRKWGSDSKIYDWSLENSSEFRLSNTEKSQMTDGFLKTFLRGGRLILFKEGSNWMVFAQDTKMALSEFSSVQVRTFGFFLFLELKKENDVFSYVEFAPWDFVSRVVDPAYDDFDRSDFFSYWVMSEFRSTS